VRAGTRRGKRGGRRAVLVGAAEKLEKVGSPHGDAVHAELVDARRDLPESRGTQGVAATEAHLVLFAVERMGQVVGQVEVVVFEFLLDGGEDLLAVARGDLDPGGLLGEELELRGQRLRKGARVFLRK
jgi:hypothetical protein